MLSTISSLLFPLSPYHQPSLLSPSLSISHPLSHLSPLSPLAPLSPTLLLSPLSCLSSLLSCFCSSLLSHVECSVMRYLAEGVRVGGGGGGPVALGAAFHRVRRYEVERRQEVQKW